MKKISKQIVSICCASSILFSGCIDETVLNNGASAEQLASSAKATESLLWAMPAFANNLGTASSSNAYDWGYGSIMHIRDVMTEEMTIVSSGYDWYTAWSGNTNIDNNKASTQFIWNYFWKFVQTTNNMIGTIDAENATNTQLGYLGVGYAFRAFLYIDMAGMFEFLENDKISSINTSGNNVLNLTVPIVKETITEDEARNNPRATRQKMYDFILDDLVKAEEYIKNLNRPNKTLPDLSVIYGLRARLHLWVGEYDEAKTYARKAIDTGNYLPVTRDQWLDTSKGFNDISNAAWMWGSQMQKEDDVVKSGILNWTSWMSNETTYGYASAGPFLMIDAKIYNKMSNDDFRKLSFRAPEGHALDGKSTYIKPEWGKETIPEYGSLKFRPASGNMEDYNVGSSSAYPLMRIEEMYFIEAEAAAHLNATEGKGLIERFMQNHRYSKYTCLATTSEGVVDEIFQQKRVEFWGEGRNFFDYKRLNKSVIRGYDGTNHSDANRFNTEGRPAWMNFCIVLTEQNNNKALVGYDNPNPSGSYTPWTGN